MEKKEIVATKSAPMAIGPYSQAVKVNGMLFVSGQLGLDPKSGNLLSDVESQVRQALKNLKAILESADSSLDSVVKTTVFLKDMNDFNSMNRIYAEYFPKNAPARCCIEVNKLPKDAKVEIEAIAKT